MTEKSNIYEALALFQEKVGTIGKDAQGQQGHRTFMYASLSAIMERIQPILTECKLAVCHKQGWVDGNSYAETIVAHWPSDEQVSSMIVFTPDPDPQEFGKQASYFCRYGLRGILNLVTDDDSDAPKQTKQRAAPKARKTQPGSPEPSKHTAPSGQTGPTQSRPSKQCPACGKGDGKDDYPLLQDREDKSQWFHWQKKGGCGWTGNPDEYVETNRIKEGEERLKKAAAELEAQIDAENEAAAEQHGL